MHAHLRTSRAGVSIVARSRGAKVTSSARLADEQLAGDERPALLCSVRPPRIRIVHAQRGVTTRLRPGGADFDGPEAGLRKRSCIFLHFL